MEFVPQRHCSGIRLYSFSHELFRQVLFATLESCLRVQLEVLLKRVENSGIVVEVCVTSSVLWNCVCEC